ncbi:MAG: CBS domain-containing protein [bacterium]
MQLVKDYMMRTLNSVHEDDTLEHAIRLMGLRETAILPVVDHTNHFLGTLYSEKILKNVLPEEYGFVDSHRLFHEINHAGENLERIKDHKVSEYMTKTAATVQENNKMKEVVKQMLKNEESYIFVTNDHGDLRGYVSRADLLLYLLDEPTQQLEED